MTGNKVGRVAGKVAFITGAARGQGREHAVRLAEEGADIIAVDVCDDIDGVSYPGATEADLADTADLVEKAGRRIVTAKADVRELESLRTAVEQGVAGLGAIDIVVANAGISGAPAPAALIEQSAWQTMLDINLTGVWHTVKVALPHMTNGGGSIILVSSMLGIRGGGYMAHYASAKHAVVGLMNSLANELAPQWIRVNSIHPGNVLTPMLDNEWFCRTLRPDLPNPTVHDAGEVIGQFHMLPKPLIEARAVSNAVLFLASDEAQYITGAALPVDAGAVAKF
ncbi:3-ketoacyl-ACP reductase [Mycobacterium intermedium]|uniref:3-ketoacyl-ACP reductase n=1 Tax=Mycobacterium intermedium TaxID=28445 RepID=A0A1E3SDN2_MYCIE|nr:mycofactocin-coupled SDR family oxidoreductase [Mycobacterium intermedium]MCV6966869.1 mycofactocin-coupled SDR family oxidoreductase [Mycobacterium intermedium]ODQ99687.1 3-ketoacyl-ACP reductase [Mycobacterium intermedium]OPE49060.1 3-ketoacyl-ACP reductase [Mycobacterium intermedium]ORB07193.1 3-ketoacyl-ACP reductase [Mycobacterium intermedium]